MVLIKLRHRKKTVLGELEEQIRGCRDHRLASLAVREKSQQGGGKDRPQGDEPTPGRALLTLCCNGLSSD